MSLISEVGFGGEGVRWGLQQAENDDAAGFEQPGTRLAGRKAVPPSQVFAPVPMATGAEMIIAQGSRPTVYAHPPSAGRAVRLGCVACSDAAGRTRHWHDSPSRGKVSPLVSDERGKLSGIRADR
jgi:hypothetical protein